MKTLTKREAVQVHRFLDDIAIHLSNLAELPEEGVLYRRAQAAVRAMERASKR